LGNGRYACGRQRGFRYNVVQVPRWKGHRCAVLEPQSGIEIDVRDIGSPSHSLAGRVDNINAEVVYLICQAELLQCHVWEAEIAQSKHVQVLSKGPLRSFLRGGGQQLSSIVGLTRVPSRHGHGARKAVGSV